MEQTDIKGEAYYFGRFQPPTVKHAGVARQIIETNPLISLTVGVANSQLPPTQENFLSGTESANLMRLTLADLELSSIGVVPVDIFLGRSFVDSLIDFFNKRSAQVVFSGSPSTIKACQMVAARFGFRIIELDDDDQSGPRARHVRNGLINGDKSWQRLVTPSVFTELQDPSYVERIKSLDSGEKRPWSRT